MPKTITVKGIGSVSAKPDYITLTLEIVSKAKDYNTSLDLANGRVARLQSAADALGFEKGSLKTGSYQVSTAYENRRDRNGNYQSVFVGYQCSYQLKLSFDFQPARLAEVLTGIAESGADAELHIAFTVKDPSKVCDELLISAAENARRKAEVLCRASGVTLGELLSVDYNWSQIDIFSHTSYCLDDDISLAKPLAAGMPDFEPEDISARDAATFVWALA